MPLCSTAVQCSNNIAHLTAAHAEHGREEAVKGIQAQTQLQVANEIKVHIR